MACLTNNGILLGCGDSSTGGARSIWIGSLDNLTFDLIAFDVDDVITGLTSAWSVDTFKKYDSTKKIASFNQELSADPTMCMKGWNQRLTMRYSKLENSKRKEMNYLVDTYTVAIIEDFNGKYWLAGSKTGFTPESGTANTNEFGNGNIYDITLLAEESEMAYEILDKAVFSSLIDND